MVRVVRKLRIYSKLARISACVSSALIVPGALLNELLFYGLYPVMENQTANSQDDFTLIPLARNVSVGETTVFQCQHSTADGIGWKLNGSLLSELNHRNISAISQPLPNGDVIYNLMFTALPEYNKTTVECVATFLSQEPATSTVPVLVLIQGPLAEVINFNRQIISKNLSYIWQQPYSLDLTAVTPDITYCLDVLRITCGVRDSVVRDCGVSGHNYTVDLDIADLYEAIITPRSNTINTVNGSETSISDEYIFISDSDWKAIVALDADSSNMTVELHIKFNMSEKSLKVIPDSFTVLFMTVDIHPVEQQMCNSTQFALPLTATMLNLTLDCLLLPRRLWIGEMYVGSCGTQQVSHAKELSTHDIQNISVRGCELKFKSSIIIGDYVDGTKATGVLLMLYSTNHPDIDAHYISKVTLRQALSTFQVIFPRLYISHSYNMSAFIIDENGLPFLQAGTSSRIIQFKPSTGLLCDIPQNYQQPLIAADLITDPDRHESCIQCTFLEESILSCVAIIHASVSYLSSTNGLLAIDVVKIDREFNNSVASHCLKQEQLNLTNHVVTIFPYNGSIIIEPAIVLQKKIGGVAVSSIKLELLFIIACTIILVLLLSMVIIMSCYAKQCYRKYSLTADQASITAPVETIEMRKCDAYEDTSLPRRNIVVMEDNPAYATFATL